MIPARDAEATLGEVIQGVKKALPEATVLVVDDGSADATSEAARDAGADVIRHEVNRGKGAALQTGFDEASRRGIERVLTLDADGQHDPAYAPRLLQALDSSDLVIGSRDGNRAGMPWIRRATNSVMTRIVSGLAGREIQDTQSGYRAYPVALFDDVALRHGGFVLETEVLIAAAGRGWQVREVPVRAIPRARRRSRFRPLGDGVAIGAYLAGRVAARWAREAAAGGWWRHPRRRRAAAAATATLAAPVLLVLLALQALVARRLPDVVTPLVERLCSQVRLDLAGEPERTALMTLAVPPEAPR